MPVGSGETFRAGAAWCRTHPSSERSATSRLLYSRAFAIMQPAGCTTAPPLGSKETASMSTVTATDRIVKTTVLHAPIERVWRAIGDSREFGTWFGMEIDGPFVAGTMVLGRA